MTDNKNVLAANCAYYVYANITLSPVPATTFCMESKYKE